jgi:hypothetical protein
MRKYGNMFTKYTVTDQTDCGECQDQVPFYPVDLSSSPSASDTLYGLIRTGLCCASPTPDRCISFNILLHPDAIGVSIYVAHGAAPDPHEWRLDWKMLNVLMEELSVFRTKQFCNILHFVNRVIIQRITPLYL